MEQLYYNLSEEEFTKDKKIMLWASACFFFIVGLFVFRDIFVTVRRIIPPILALPPFVVCLVIICIGLWEKLRRKDLFFLVDEGKIEFRFGIFKAKRHSFKWAKISSIVMPLSQRKIKLNLNDGTCFVINLTFFKREKSTAIKNYIYKLAGEKEIKITIVKRLLD
jgi:hypothetical protein